MITINIPVTDGMVRLWESKFFLIWIIGLAIYQKTTLGLINTLLIIAFLLFTRLKLFTVILISMVFVIVAGVFLKI